MTTQKPSTSADNDRLGIYLAHFAHHLAEHLHDLTHHRARETETAELSRLLDEASASIEVSKKAIERALVQLDTEHGSGRVHDHDHEHGHGAHHHHHGSGAHSHG